MFTDAGRATTFRHKYKASSLQAKSTKNQGPSDNMGFTETPSEDFGRKIYKNNIILTFMKQPREHKGPKWNSLTWTLQPKRNELFFERGIQIETVKVSAIFQLVKS